MASGVLDMTLDDVIKLRSKFRTGRTRNGDRKVAQNAQVLGSTVLGGEPRRVRRVTSSTDAAIAPAAKAAAAAARATATKASPPIFAAAAKNTLATGSATKANKTQDKLEMSLDDVIKTEVETRNLNRSVLGQSQQSSLAWKGAAAKRASHRPRVVKLPMDAQSRLLKTSLGIRSRVKRMALRSAGGWLRVTDRGLQSSSTRRPGGLRMWRGVRGLRSGLSVEWKAGTKRKLERGPLAPTKWRRLSDVGSRRVHPWGGSIGISGTWGAASTSCLSDTWRHPHPLDTSVDGCGCAGWNRSWGDTDADWTTTPKGCAVKRNTGGGGAHNGHRIRVANVPKNLDWREIKEAFEDSGRVVRCEVDRDIAWITFEDAKIAKKAVQTFDHGELNGQTIFVSLE